MQLIQFLYPLLITLAFLTISSIFHYKIYTKKDFSFAIILYGILIFSIVYSVSFEDNLGLGIGLLGILSIIRLRSTPENFIDIGFIFYSITIGLINASIPDQILFTTGINTILTTLLIGISFYINKAPTTYSISLTLDEINLDLIDSTEYISSKISAKTNLNIKEIQIIKIDYIKESVNLKVYYESQK